MVCNGVCKAYAVNIQNAASGLRGVLDDYDTGDGDGAMQCNATTPTTISVLSSVFKRQHGVAKHVLVLANDRGSTPCFNRAALKRERKETIDWLEKEETVAVMVMAADNDEEVCRGRIEEQGGRPTAVASTQKECAASRSTRAVQLRHVQ